MSRVDKGCALLAGGALVFAYGLLIWNAYAGEPTQDCCFKVNLYEKAMVHAISGMKDQPGHSREALESALRLSGKQCEWSGETFRCK